MSTHSSPGSHPVRLKQPRRNHHKKTLRTSEPSEKDRAERELRLIAEVGSVLATTLEFEDTLTNIARLVVENLADLCVINFIDDNDVVRRVRVFCGDPAKAWVCDALMRSPPGGQQARIARTALETRKPSLIAHVTPELIRSWAGSEEQLAAFQSFGPQSAIVVPLMVHGRLLGALSVISCGASRSYCAADVRVVEAIAGRAAFFLEHARLYRAARQAAQARADLLGVVAHDLRNPLTTIGTLAAYLRSHSGESEVGREIEHATHRMDRLIQDLLDVTRIEAGRLSNRPERVNPAELMREALEAQLPLAASASLDLQLQAGQDLPDLWADRDRLLQVFDNLIGNAIKFTKPGGRITLGATAREGQVEFFVADTGCGIAGDQLPHVFDRFWQAPGTQRGSGLGLTIVRGIVEAHGGHVRVESSPGQGSTFFFTVPAARQPAVPDPQSDLVRPPVNAKRAAR